MEDEEYDDDYVAESSGISVTLPKFVNWRQKQVYDYEQFVSDYSDFEALDKAMTAARRALFIITDKINEYDRKSRGAKKSYERAYQSAYLESTEKTSEAKRFRAAIKCEDLENEWIMLDQLKEELTRTSFTLKSELNTLQTIAHNLRQQLKM